MRSLPFLLAVALAAPLAVPAVAQSNIILTAPPSSYGCPVGLTVERQSGLRLYRANVPDPGQASRSIHPSPAAQGVHVRLTDQGDRTIVSADIVVHGYATKPRVTPASTAHDEDVTKTFHLTPDARSTDERSSNVLVSDLWVENMGGIRNVTVASIEYASGPAWQTSKAAFCTAAPNPLLLVGTLR